VDLIEKKKFAIRSITEVEFNTTIDLNEKKIHSEKY